MATNPNERLEDDVIRHAVFLERYSKGVVRRMLGLLREADKDLAVRLATLGDRSNDDVRIQIIQRRADIKRTTAELTDALRRMLEGDVGAIADFEVDFMKSAGGRVLADSAGDLSKEVVRAAAMSKPFSGVHLKWAKLTEHVTEWGRRRTRLAEQAIKRGYIEGESVADIIRALRGTRRLNYRDGLLDQTRREIEAIARTSINHISNAAHMEVYKEAEDDLEGVRWVSILDSRTSPICRARSGKIYPVGDGPRPPAHPNCRSRVVGIVLGVGIPKPQNYQGWLKKQPVGVQDEILGNTRGKLFRQGGLDLERFVDMRTGRQYSLDDLKKQHADAFAKIKD